jgi:hypothetical protein
MLNRLDQVYPTYAQCGTWYALDWMPSLDAQKDEENNWKKTTQAVKSHSPQGTGGASLVPGTGKLHSKKKEEK